MNKSTKKPSARFKPFKWVELDDIEERIPAARAVDLLGAARDIASGMGCIFQMLEQVQIESANSDEDGEDLPPLFNVTTAGRLCRLGISAAELLTGAVDRYHMDLQRLSARPSSVEEKG